MSFSNRSQPLNTTLERDQPRNRFNRTDQQQLTSKSQAGVIEAQPGIIESTNIDPLNKNSNKDDGWANVTKPAGAMNTAASLASSAAMTAASAAKLMYGAAVGDQATKEAGREGILGSSK